MQFGGGAKRNVDWMREELTDLGIEELKTVDEVDRAMDEYDEGTMLMVINSVCGCAASNARPSVEVAFDRTEHMPDRSVTVFAGPDQDATDRAREYFSEYPPSSPAFAYFVDGDIKAMIPRHRIEGRSKEEIAEDLEKVFEAFDEKEVA